MNICKKCIWSNKIDSNLLFCILPSCIIKDEIKQAVVVKEAIVLPKDRKHCEDKSNKQGGAASDRCRKRANTRSKSKR